MIAQRESSDGSRKGRSAAPGFSERVLLLRARCGFGYRSGRSQFARLMGTYPSKLKVWETGSAPFRRGVVLECMSNLARAKPDVVFDPERFADWLIDGGEMPTRDGPQPPDDKRYAVILHAPDAQPPPAAADAQPLRIALVDVFTGRVVHVLATREQLDAAAVLVLGASDEAHATEKSEEGAVATPKRESGRVSLAVLPFVFVGALLVQGVAEKSHLCGSQAA